MGGVGDARPYPGRAGGADPTGARAAASLRVRPVRRGWPAGDRPGGEPPPAGSRSGACR